MSIPAISATRLGGSPDLPPLVVGPSLGTSVGALWSVAGQRLTRNYHVIGWDLPGHGASPPPRDAFSIADLAAAVIGLVDREIGRRSFTYAGVSVAGAVGLQLLLVQPERMMSAALIGTAPRIGDPDDWRSRAQIARTAGTGELVARAGRRWFAPALAGFDARGRLGQIDTPVVAVAGAALKKWR